jgi:hypothetical protein
LVCDVVPEKMFQMAQRWPDRESTQAVRLWSWAFKTEDRAAISAIPGVADVHDLTPPLALGVAPLVLCGVADCRAACATPFPSSRSSRSPSAEPNSAVCARSSRHRPTGRRRATCRSSCPEPYPENTRTNPVAVSGGLPGSHAVAALPLPQRDPLAGAAMGPQAGAGLTVALVVAPRQHLGGGCSRCR